MSKIKLFPSGHEVDCDNGETVLSALEKAGFALPNNCRAGACGECKIKVRNGQFDQGMVLDMALSQEEREEGYGLMCMAKPLSDTLEIEWGTEDAQPKLFPPRENVPFVVVERLERTPRIVELRLRPLG
ncbi:MAG: 2Fe-2S iron-sulfur cluster-binding protein, partial [Chromatiales bacterium]|nr:2Fe-2S iron-sulfur cluster-binding protein [Chromatiales bacterium]